MRIVHLLCAKCTNVFSWSCWQCRFFGSIKVFRVPADAQEAKFVLMLLDSRRTESIRRYTFICHLNVAQWGCGNRSAHLMLVFNCYCPFEWTSDFLVFSMRFRVKLDKKRSITQLIWVDTYSFKVFEAGPPNECIIDSWYFEAIDYSLPSDINQSKIDVELVTTLLVKILTKSITENWFPKRINKRQGNQFHRDVIPFPCNNTECVFSGPSIVIQWTDNCSFPLAMKLPSENVVLS